MDHTSLGGDDAAKIAHIIVGLATEHGVRSNSSWMQFPMYADPGETEEDVLKRYDADTAHLFKKE